MEPSNTEDSREATNDLCVQFEGWQRSMEQDLEVALEQSSLPTAVAISQWRWERFGDVFKGSRDDTKFSGALALTSNQTVEECDGDSSTMHLFVRFNREQWIHEWKQR